MRPVEIIDHEKIRRLVVVCIMLHNMMVQERLDHDGLDHDGLDEDDFANDDSVFGSGNDTSPMDAVQEEEQIVEDGVQKRKNRSWRQRCVADYELSVCTRKTVFRSWMLPLSMHMNEFGVCHK